VIQVPSAPRKSPVVLVVDDDPTMRLLARSSLQPVGLTVEEASDGEEAIRAFARCRPDLVLLDVQMPGIDGFEVCEQLRRDPAAGDVPVVMMTGLEDTDSVRHAYDSGATDFVAKPIPWLVLSQRVRHLLRASGAYAELRRSRERLAAAQRLARMGSFYIEIANGVFHGSDELGSLYDLPTHGARRLEQLIERVHPDDRPRFEAGIRACLDGAVAGPLDHRVLVADGSERILHVATRLSLDGDGRAVALEGTVQDVTEARQANERIRYLAYHDSLTGLGNRVFFKERLAVAIERARRTRTHIGILFLDLDNFKRINDTLGHSAGDTLLRKVADRLRSSIRLGDSLAHGREDEVEPTVSRLGGDEFTVLLSDLDDPCDAATVANRILASLAKPFELEGHEVVIGASIGITVWPVDGDDIEALLRNADTAMYHAKEHGRNNFQFYTESMNEAALRRLILEGKLRRALDNDELLLHFQPRFSLSDGAITGLEALVRWREPELGMVMPGDFIPIAEESGLIVPIGQWVLRAACEQMERWRAEGLAPLPVAVNVSLQQFQHNRFASYVVRVLGETGADPAQLELEITESTLARDEGVVAAALRELRTLGVRIAIDDFGTGYSCLSYLRRLPLDVLKIDRHFVAGIETSAEDAALTAAIVNMGKALRLRLVAEGVETEGQRRLLAAWKCEEMQGFLLAKPMPADEISALLRERTRRAPAA
jgi:diguanylate cyclase (GGDEF)-like protein